VYNFFIDGRSCHPELKDGGALQISVQGFQVDYYPYHLAKCDRTHWPKYVNRKIILFLFLIFFSILFNNKLDIKMQQYHQHYG